MERNVQRINGEVTHLHQLSDAELDNMRGYALERVHDQQTDIERLETEIAARRPVAQLALEMSWPDPDNVTRVDFTQSRVDL